jgi:hypothetical protein
MTDETAIQQVSQEKTIGIIPEVVLPKEAIERDGVPVGAGCAGRSEDNAGKNGGEMAEGVVQEGKKRVYPRRRTVKGRKKRRPKNAGGRAATGKRAGLHIPRGVFEAIDILTEEGYITGRIDDPAIVFDLVARRGRHTILIHVVRPKEPVGTAREVRDLYEQPIRRIQPYWTSPDDDLQLWVFSREVGLIRYRVYDWGIWNVEKVIKSMQKSEKPQSSVEIATQEPVIRRARNSPCPDAQTGQI